MEAVLYPGTAVLAPIITSNHGAHHRNLHPLAVRGDRPVTGRQRGSKQMFLRLLQNSFGKISKKTSIYLGKCLLC